MATSSITKQFVAKDRIAYEKLVQQVKAVKPRSVKTTMPDRLVKGNKLVRRFSFH
jgi:hypothetical protein